MLNCVPGKWVSLQLLAAWYSDFQPKTLLYDPFFIVSICSVFYSFHFPFGLWFLIHFPFHFPFVISFIYRMWFSWRDTAKLSRVFVSPPIIYHGNLSWATYVRNCDTKLNNSIESEMTTLFATLQCKVSTWYYTVTHHKRFYIVGGISPRLTQFSVSTVLFDTLATDLKLHFI